MAEVPQWSGGQNQVYHVPVISPDLRPAEGMHQILDSLEYLDNVVTDVFSRISKRVESERSHLTSLANRVTVAQNKIGQIAGTSRATTVFSSAHYPAPKQLDAFVPLYHDAAIESTSGRKHKIPEDQKVISHHGGSREPARDFRQLLQAAAEREQARSNVVHEGLGRLPKNLSSVSSLLLFNTSDNPYNEYVHLDPLMGVDVEKRRSEDAEKGLADAPKTIVDGDTLPQFGMLEYNFKPKMGAVPEFDLPSNLDLPNIADLAWAADESQQTGIAPSQAPLPSVPTVPEMPSATTTTQPQAAQQAGGAPETPSGGGPPPPPPSDVPASVAAPDTGRNALLDAIRGAGKGALKKVEKDPEDPDKPKAPPAAAPNTMMGDLMAALDRRRKGIGGKLVPQPKKEKKEEAAPALPKLRPVGERKQDAEDIGPIPMPQPGKASRSELPSIGDDDVGPPVGGEEADDDGFDAPLPPPPVPSMDNDDELGGGQLPPPPPQAPDDDDEDDDADWE